MSYKDWLMSGGTTPPHDPTPEQIWDAATASERTRIVALIRAEANDNKGMAWPHADFSLTALADHIQGTS